jgi:hypothetical protein
VSLFNKSSKIEDKQLIHLSDNNLKKRNKWTIF